MSIPNPTYFPSITRLVCLLFVLFLTACGGGSASPSTTPVSAVAISLISSVQEIEAGSPNVVVSANVSGSNAVPNWTMVGEVGSLSSNTGNTVEYIPPLLGSLDSDTIVIITANIGSVTKSLTLSVRPSASGVYAFAGGIGGRGLLDGSGTAARFNFPLDIVTDAEDNVYVQDKKNGLIRKLSSDGVVSTFADLDESLWLRLRYFSGRFLFTATATQAQLILPDGSKILVDNSFIPEVAAYRDIDGNLYVRGTSFFDGPWNRILKNHQLLAGGAVGVGAKDGIGAEAGFVFIGSLRVLPNKMVYVLDREPAGDRYQLRQITQEGVVSTLSGMKFESPARIIPNTGMLPVVLDRNGIHKLSAGGDWISTPISDGNLIPGTNTQYDGADVTADKNGNMYITDPNKNLIIRVTEQGKVSVFAGMDSNPLGTTIDGKGGNARLSQPVVVTKDRAGYFYVIDYRSPPAESSGFRNDPLGLTLRKISPAGVVTTLVAPGVWWGQADNTGVAETFSVPTGMAVDSQGNIWIIDRPSYRGGGFSWNAVAIGGNAIRKISADGKIVKVFADAVSCLGFSSCEIKIDESDNLFVLDMSGVRQLNINGGMTKLAGMETFNSIGTFYPDKKGNLYFADSRGIYKRSANGSINKLTNTVISVYSNSWENRMLVDDNENVYFSTDCTLRKLAATGIETVVAGVSGQRGNRLGSLQSARLHNITSMTWLGPKSLALTSADAVLKVVLP